MIRYAPILTLIFITLRLSNYIDWTWFEVLSPLMIWAMYYTLVMITATLVRGVDKSEALSVWWLKVIHDDRYE